MKDAVLRTICFVFMLHELTSHLASSRGHFESLKGFISQKPSEAVSKVFLLFSGGRRGVEDFQPALMCVC